jgi:hypothetical protein
LDVLPQRSPAPAIRPAENAGCGYGAEKSRAPIAIANLLPSLLCIDGLWAVDRGLHGCELNIARHEHIVVDLRFPYTPILACNSKESQFTVLSS